MSDNAIEVRGLVKSFGAVHALQGLDLLVPTGGVTGFLGPNGSGKTTTIRIVLGLIRADAGRVSLLGGDPWTQAVALHKRLAYVPGDVALWPNLTGGAIIDVLGALAGGLEPARKAAMIERFQLDPTRKAGTYSKGNRQKVALVAALASRVELLVLDEPTSGLDPIMEAEFQAVIREVKAEGRSVLLSSHIFAEVETLADQVAIIREGRTVEQGTLASLRHLARTQVRVGLDDPARAIALPGTHAARVEGREAVFDVDAADLPAVLAGLAPLGPSSLVANPPSLEEIFLSHYADELGDAGVAAAPIESGTK
ncbi:MAG: ABC transporter ATP-binding protein [Propionibacteriaceae bacterium]|nr:ABC transporter ATP-binding protein [Propionibacteriaceae bacterium]